MFILDIYWGFYSDVNWGLYSSSEVYEHYLPKYDWGLYSGEVLYRMFTVVTYLPWLGKMPTPLVLNF